MTKLIEAYLRYDDRSSPLSSSSAMGNSHLDASTNLTIILLQILNFELSKIVYPFHADRPTSAIHPDAKELAESIQNPLFSMFKFLVDKSDQESKPLRTLIAQMGTNNQEIGFHLLYFLSVAQIPSNTRKKIYREYVIAMGKDLTACLHQDMKACALKDNNMLGYLVPQLYAQFHPQLVNYVEPLALVLEHADSRLMQHYYSGVLLGDFKFFRKDSIMNILSKF